MRKKITFEDAFQELNAIVRELESGTITIEEALAKYKKGVELIENCNKILKDAKLQTSVILTEKNSPKGGDGEVE